MTPYRNEREPAPPEPLIASSLSASELPARLDAIVAAESRCCPFLAMRVTDEPGTVVLRIDAPDGAEGVLRTLVDAFGAPDAPENAS